MPNADATPATASGATKEPVASASQPVARGTNAIGDHDDILNKTACLSLLANGELGWNTVHIAQIVDRLRASREEVLYSDLASVLPLCHARIIPNGTDNLDGDNAGVILSIIR